MLSKTFRKLMVGAFALALVVGAQFVFAKAVKAQSTVVYLPVTSSGVGQVPEVIAADSELPCIPHRGIPSIVRSAAYGCGVIFAAENIYEDYVIGNIHHFVAWQRPSNIYGEGAWSGWMLELNKNNPNIQMCWFFHQNQNARIQCLIDLMPLESNWLGPFTLDNLVGSGDLYCHYVSVNASQTELEQRICRQDGDWVRTVQIENGVIQWGEPADNWGGTDDILPSEELPQ